MRLQLNDLQLLWSMHLIPEHSNFLTVTYSNTLFSHFIHTTSTLFFCTILVSLSPFLSKWLNSLLVLHFTTCTTLFYLLLDIWNIQYSHNPLCLHHSHFSDNSFLCVSQTCDFHSMYVPVSDLQSYIILILPLSSIVNYSLWLCPPCYHDCTVFKLFYWPPFQKPLTGGKFNMYNDCWRVMGKGWQITNHKHNCRYLQQPPH